MYHVFLAVDEFVFEGMAELRYDLDVIEAFFEDGSCVAAPIAMISALEVL